jgi:Flp pilus assembly protein TadD
MKHKVPKQAEKEYKNAHKKFTKGDIDGSLTHLKRATEIDPEYLEAWNNLGCRLMMKNQPYNGLAAFRRAVVLDPQAPLVHGNLAIAFLSIGQMSEAETAARKAISIDASDRKARLILGTSLVAQRKFTDEALTLLRQVSDEFPKARQILADVLARRGESQDTKAVVSTLR